MTRSATVRMPSRVTSLRSRWNRAFVVLGITFVVLGVGSFAGMRSLVDAFGGAAQDVERQATISAQLRADVDEFPNSIRPRAPGAPEARPRSEIMASIEADFVTAIEVEDDARATALLEEGFAQWHEVAGLPILQGDRPLDVEDPATAALIARNVPKLGNVFALLERSGVASRAAARANLAQAGDRERQVISAVTAFGVLAMLVVVLLARRLSVEVIRPIRSLRDSANHLAVGDLDHRVVIDRSDELGELAVSFNAMADAISGSQRSLTLKANTDSLSGLPNRAAFCARLDDALARPERRAHDQAVLFIDLDDFKEVNDTLGHAAGDELLGVVAECLNAAVRPGDMVARLGGDEFAMLLEGLPDTELAFTIADRVVDALAEPILIGAAWAHVGASIGLAVPDSRSTRDTLMQQADVAMYAAKAKGKNRVERYDAGLDHTASEWNRLAPDLAGAADR